MWHVVVWCVVWCVVVWCGSVFNVVFPFSAAATHTASHTLTLGTVSHPESARSSLVGLADWRSICSFKAVSKSVAE